MKRALGLLLCVLSINVYSQSFLEQLPFQFEIGKTSEKEIQSYAHCVLNVDKGDGIHRDFDRYEFRRGTLPQDYRCSTGHYSLKETYGDQKEHYNVNFFTSNSGKLIKIEGYQLPRYWTQHGLREGKINYFDLLSLILDNGGEIDKVDFRVWTGTSEGPDKYGWASIRDQDDIQRGYSNTLVDDYEGASGYHIHAFIGNYHYKFNAWLPANWASQSFDNLPNLAIQSLSYEITLAF
ncbi:hypothetical protein BIZ37_26425 [Photobacterium sp. BZF1]|uniref:hypothetical protein n=1 Tax=Photobacterium sp. BZF1 TaxID=1904457 RepID=UPI0016534EE7|nr:hypothetical protein [Photobacterium sp. BZF1]MBC7006100.1 hypothetical protein [Photobacterium sp. BZF1]